MIQAGASVEMVVAMIAEIAIAPSLDFCQGRFLIIQQEIEYAGSAK